MISLPRTPARRTHGVGFTLIEILVVVIIIGLLATIVSVSVRRHVGTTQVTTTRMNIKAIRGAIGLCEVQVGRLPKDLNELVFEGDEKWPGPFLEAKEVPKDGWGKDFRFTVPGKRYEVRSAGPDGQFDTEDDLWE